MNNFDINHVELKELNMNGSCVETVQGLQKLNLAFIFRNSTQLNLDAFLKSIISLFVTFSAILQKMLDDLKDIDHQYS